MKRDTGPASIFGRPRESYGGCVSDVERFRRIRRVFTNGVTNTEEAEVKTESSESSLPHRKDCIPRRENVDKNVHFSEPVFHHQSHYRHHLRPRSVEVFKAERNGEPPSPPPRLLPP